VDQFAVKALLIIGDLPETPLLEQMNPTDLNVNDGVVLIEIMRRKAAQNNRLFGTDAWMARKIDKVLWTYGRPTAS
jgi:hypothetical protein